MNVLNVEWLTSLDEAREKLAARPHSSLGYRTPEAFRRSYTPSPRISELPQILASVKATLWMPAAALTGAPVCKPQSNAEAMEKNELNQNGIVV